MSVAKSLKILNNNMEARIWWNGGSGGVFRPATNRSNIDPVANHIERLLLGIIRPKYSICLGVNINIKEEMNNILRKKFNLSKDDLERFEVYAYNLFISVAVGHVFKQIEDKLGWWVDMDNCSYCQKRKEQFTKPHYWWERYCIRHGTLFWFRDNIYLLGKYAKGYIIIEYDENNDVINKISVEACNRVRCGYLSWTPDEIVAKVFAEFRYRNYNDPRSTYCKFTRLLFGDILIEAYSRT